MIWFAIASLTPAVCLALACVLGGVWPLLSVLSITVFAFAMDKLSARLMPDTRGRAGLPLNFALVAAHFTLWPLGLWALAGPDLGGVEKALLAVGLGLYFGQVGNANAHELIHQPMRWARGLGTAVYCSLLFGHHVSAHLRVHHHHAATPRDPNTARMGEGFWAFLLRAWPEGFRAGLRAETALRHRGGQTTRRRVHPYLRYALGSALAVLAAVAIAGAAGVLWLLVLSAYAQVQLFLSDYVQHYGLERAELAPGRVEPMGPAHSWNAPHWYSGAMMLNAPRHSAHHLRPGTPYAELTLDAGHMPMLPASLPVMAVAALVPPVWCRVMDGRARAWRGRNLPIAAE